LDAAVAIDGSKLVIVRQKTLDRGVGAVAAQTAVLVPVRRALPLSQKRLRAARWKTETSHRKAQTQG
jgi:hypothetical protein